MEQPILNDHNKQEYPPSHTAEHLLNQTMIRMFGCERSRNAHIERKKSKISWPLPECPTEEQVQEIERRMNEVISQGLPVTYEFGDYDICACIGFHVGNTHEIGTFKINSWRYDEHGVFRIVFKLV